MSSSTTTAFQMKTGDEKPHITATLGGGPTSWAGATAKIVIADENGVVQYDSSTGVTLDTDAKTVDYDWTGFDTTVEGYYTYEWVVVFADADEMTCPAEGVLEFRINSGIGE